MCGAARFPDAVVPVVVPEGYEAWNFSVELRRSDLIDMVKLYAQNCATQDNGPAVRSITRSAQEFIDALGEQEIHDPVLTGLFDRALTIEKCTAWVCANDYIALHALSYLEKKGIAVPQQIGVVGFDDCEDAINYELTSYNFNLPVVARMMVSSVLYPRSFPLGNEGNRYEVDGVVRERRSSTSYKKRGRKGK
jgi:DNA-binding LacI/PurR family transcriptional regulator